MFKVITEVLAIRLKPVLSSLISLIQSGFIEGRSILDGSLILSKLIYWAKTSRKKILVFKVDFKRHTTRLIEIFLWVFSNT